MNSTVEIPLWVLVLVLGFAAIAALDRVLVPSVRWFFRRRMERAVAELNKRLERPIQPFKLMRRQDMIVRLIYDPHVMEAVVDYAHEEGVPESVAFQQARSYAREIVPSFSASTYFGFAIRIARALSRALYMVRLGQYDAAAIRAIDRKATIVFVMNHRSNMDYVLVTWLAAERSALSYAVGEWGRVWPLQGLIRAMGAYFIRRRYLNPLYRRVLARYVQMATQEGVTQALFPEGRLSLDGRVGPAKMGLLHYIVGEIDPEKGRDVVFLPVALNYDRVLEDRVLLAAGESGQRRFRVRFSTLAGFVLRHVWQRLRGRYRRFGYAAVSFGAPLSLTEFRTQNPEAGIDALADVLMARIREAVPVLPVPLVAAVLLRADTPLSESEIMERATPWVDSLRAHGYHVHMPGGDAGRAVGEGIAALTLRGILVAEEGRLRAGEGQEAALAFYANSIMHILDADAERRSAASEAIPATPARLRRPGEGVET
ncbi:1-acyl-sn-glycerol-3-phosphate acyltransferase [Alkalilacustris brevis]|uniref:1-acyl-sn-glycerol-3-phosphate acyltransferase n=1 Tax=Alkalilacustris brevis TaxID=2026338 RepID=UPI000E0CFFD1|nr:1-acyl-sn-glycerol-3-phosphate acyltransferase [Alkalilacustris brevis]